MSDEQKKRLGPVPSAHVEHEDALDEDLEDIPRDTVWHNPTDREYVLPLFVGTSHLIGKKAPMGADGKPIRRTGIKRYRIPAGEERAIPAEFDKAIQDVHNGTIVGGLGPHLVRRGSQVQAKLAPALNEAEANKKAATERAVRAMLEKAAAQEALADAEADRKQAEAAQAVDEKRAAPAAAAPPSAPSDGSGGKAPPKTPKEK